MPTPPPAAAAAATGARRPRCQVLGGGAQRRKSLTRDALRGTDGQTRVYLRIILDRERGKGRPPPVGDSDEWDEPWASELGYRAVQLAACDGTCRASDAVITAHPSSHTPTHPPTRRATGQRARQLLLLLLLLTSSRGSYRRQSRIAIGQRLSQR